MNKSILACALLLVASPALADVKLPSVISDNMLLQKSPKAALWGWADAGESVKATLGSINGAATAGADGRWRIELNTTSLTPGPHELTIAGRNTLTIKNVAIGEVWFCSGQSNMEWKVGNTIGAKEAIAQSANPMIRHFLTKQTAALKPASDVEGKWEVASPATTPGFTAVGYYFARQVNATLGVPVGLIHSSWGGTPIESWTSFQGAEADPDLKAKRDAQIDAFVRMEETYQQYVKALGEWENKYNRQDPGNKGEAAGWHKPEFDTSDWKKLPEGPRRFRLAGFKGGGAVWFRHSFELPPKAEGKPLQLVLRGNLGNSTVYFNGVCIGQTTQETFKANYIRRYYTVPANLIKAGPVTVALRYFSSGDDGGTENRYVLLQGTDGFFMTIENNWVAKPEFELPDMTSEQRSSQPSWQMTYESNTATMLYNGMVAPLTPYTVTVNLPEYPGALRNPLMGISPKNYTSRATYGAYDPLRGMHPWGTLTRTCIPWSWLENDEKDGVEKIREVTDRLFAGLENSNTKAMPRVYLFWPGKEEKHTSNPFYMRGEFWPADMKKQDISSQQFKTRLKRLIARLGEVWDDDPRIGIIEMGIIGKWGEQSDPAITPEMETILGDAFKSAFKHKKIMTRVRPITNFDAYPFGLHWDSFAHQDQLTKDGDILANSPRWKLAPFGGETAYDWGNYKVQPGLSPTDSLANPVHRDFIVNWCRKLHMTQLGWLAEYDQSNPDAQAGAEALQKVLGYRFVLQSVTFPNTVQPGGKFKVSFKVRNDGSAPFYENWPVALFLLDPASHRVVWQHAFDQVDIRQWMPGEKWDESANAYAQPPKTHEGRGDFDIPRNLPAGEYVLALGVLDPQGGMLPTLRFSNQNYWIGGYFPLGRCGVGTVPATTQVDAKTYQDPGADRTIHYINPRETPEQRAAREAAEQLDPLFLLRPVHWWDAYGNLEAKASVEVRNVTQPNPALILRYDFTNAGRGAAAMASSDLRLHANAKALKFFVKSDTAAQLSVVLAFSNKDKWEYRWHYDTPGQAKEISVPLDASKLMFGNKEKVLRFPLTSFSIRVQKTPEFAASGAVEISSFRVETTSK